MLEPPGPAPAPPGPAPAPPGPPPATVPGPPPAARPRPGKAGQRTNLPERHARPPGPAAPAPAAPPMSRRTADRQERVRPGYGSGREAGRNPDQGVVGIGRYRMKPGQENGQHAEKDKGRKQPPHLSLPS